MRSELIDRSHPFLIWWIIGAVGYFRDLTQSQSCRLQAFLRSSSVSCTNFPSGPKHDGGRGLRLNWSFRGLIIFGTPSFARQRGSHEYCKRPVQITSSSMCTCDIVRSFSETKGIRVMWIQVLVLESPRACGVNSQNGKRGEELACNALSTLPQCSVKLHLAK